MCEGEQGKFVGSVKTSFGQSHYSGLFKDERINWSVFFERSCFCVAYMMLKSRYAKEVLSIALSLTMLELLTI